MLGTLDSSRREKSTPPHFLGIVPERIMTEPDKTDHWASLASHLGAEPAPEEPTAEALPEGQETGAEGQTAAAAPPPTVSRPAAKPVRPPRRPARPAAWDQLAGDLGIAPAPPPPPPASSAVPPSAASTSPQPSPGGRWGTPRSAERPSAFSPPPQASPEGRVATQPPVERPKEIAEIDIVEAELSMPVWNELEPPATEPESFEPQEALDIMDETADEFADEESEEAAATSESARAEAAADERRPRRRHRRRGRGRGREDAPATKARTSSEPGDSEFSEGQAGERDAGGEGRAGKPDVREEAVVFEGMESDAGDLVKETAEEDRIEGEPRSEGEPRPEGEPTERRGRRRRRGRGRDRDRVRDEQTVGEEGTADDDEFDFEGTEQEEAVAAEAADEHDEDEGDEHDFDGDEEQDGEHDDEEGGESPRIGFRNIPTWKDAIGVMISKNLESRSRNPGNPRGSGGRGGRGGRGRGPRPDRR